MDIFIESILKIKEINVYPFIVEKSIVDNVKALVYTGILIKIFRDM